MTTSKGRNRLRIGDVVEVKAGQGIAYLLYVGRHDVYGDAIRVFPHWHEHPIADVTAIPFEAGYFAFYPVRTAAAQDLVTVLAPAPLPDELRVPTKLRRRGAIDRNGKVLAWIISDGKGEIVKRELSDEEKRLPIGEIWNHEILVASISRGWTPEQESGACEEPSVVTNESVLALSDRIRAVHHYLYFPAESSASTAAATLRVQGFKVESRQSAVGTNWLVLATNFVGQEQTDFGEMRHIFEAIAREGSGEYDGWEWELESPSEPDC